MQTYLKLASLIAACLAILLLTGPAAAQTTDPPPPTDPALLAKIDPRLLKQLTLDGAAQANILVELAPRADLSPALAVADAELRREVMIAALQNTAATTQQGVQAELQQAVQLGRAANVRSLWITNAVAARSDLETVLALAARDDVRLVRLDAENYLTEPVEPGWSLALPFLHPNPQSATAAVGWNIARIRADQVWSGFGLDGSGVVVANIDTGVDYRHPALHSSYRGYAGGSLPDNHTGNWHDSIGDNAQYPVDSSGHGTHTMGTMVGSGGIGVAPGARWIAVRAFNTQFGLDSWIHDAFQWLLAPAGDPNLAPDVVNNSWGNSNGSLTTFEGDIQLLKDAGILPVFAAGNSGPSLRTVGSPGSLDIALAVGALDSGDEVAFFSSRGPSPWGTVKPEISAPGVNVRSSLPGGTYGESSGTSMAAPHVSGVAALLRQANPGLTPDQTTGLLLSSAVPLTTTIPNNHTGYGRVDAYAAVAQALQAGTLTGTVATAGSGSPIAGATVSIAPHGDGAAGQATTDAAGVYRRSLAANTYDVTASAFGHQSQTVFGVTVSHNVTTRQDFSLTALPAGTLAGVVTKAGSGQPLTATITINDTPATAAAALPGGNYSLSLPAGVYTVTVTNPGHRVAVKTGVSIAANKTTAQDFALEPAPTILLVDSGRWYYDSQIAYYRQALDDLRYYYDELPIKNPPQDTPISATLSAYDIVIWSAPLDSPGYVGADPALSGYLDGGGRLFLSGQDVAYFDGGGSPFVGGAYFANQLHALWTADDAATSALTGDAGELFAGLSLTISGGDGANNQTDPDVIELRPADDIAPVLHYEGGALAGHRVDACLGHRAIFLPFGLEGVNDRLDRAEVLSRTIAWLSHPPAPAGVELDVRPEPVVGAFGQTVSQTVRLRNTAGISGTDTFQLTLSGAGWTTTFPYSQETLYSCESRPLTFTVQIPAGANWSDSDTVTVTARSTVSPALTVSVTRTTKAPAPVLLVDDDRWFDFQADYRQALESDGIPYDVWSTNNNTSKRAPTLADLQKYPIVLWYTAYDWFDPITPDEETMLAAYLDGGGRLFLSSQDYFYNLPDHKAGDFARDYLGILDHTEDVTSTAVSGVAGNPLGAGLGPYPLAFPLGYKNWTDAITVSDTANIATIAHDGWPNGAIFAGAGAETFHTAFFGYGVELMDAAARARVLERVVGWLSWLGTSTVAPHAPLAADGDVISYTAVIRNDGPAGIASAAFTATFPANLNYVPGSAGGGLAESGGDLVWSGPLARGESRTFTYRGAFNGAIPPGTIVTQPTYFVDNDHGLAFDGSADVRANVPSLEGSGLAVEPGLVAKDGVLTYTLTLYNSGVADAPLVTATVTLADALTWDGGAQASRGLTQTAGQVLTWTLDLAKAETATLVYRARLAEIPFPFQVTTTALADDGFIHDNRWSVAVPVKPYEYWLPLTFK